MTNQEINIAIAEICGWKKQIRRGFDGENFSQHYEELSWYQNDIWKLEGPPNYCTDLNSMHEAEAALSALDHQKFCLFLHKSIMGTMDNFDINGACNLECVSRVVKATARQRAEAFLRTIEKWKE